MSRKRTEHLTIAADENIIDMIDAWRAIDPSFPADPRWVESYWDEFADIMGSLSKEIEKIRESQLILTCRCAPCDLTFETPISTQLGSDMFRDVCCPQCGNENPNAVKTKNYRAWEKETE